MLRLVIASTFTLLVSVTFPSTDPRKPITGTFTARFKDMNREQLRSLSKDVEAGITDDDHLDRILDDGDAIGQIGDSDGNLLPPEQQRKMVYERLPLGKAVIAAFYDQVGGVGGKNSLLSRVR